jgi:hypothetical protein
METDLTGGHGPVTAALHHALSTAPRGSCHSVLSVAARAVQWLQREEGMRATMFGRITRNVTFDAMPRCDPLLRETCMRVVSWTHVAVPLVADVRRGLT